MINGTELQESISHYFGTIMRGVFVGVLFAIGVFLFSYVGYERTSADKWYERSDNGTGNVACFFAIVVALFPTTSSVEWIRVVHLLAAVGLFLTLAYMSFFLFTKSKGKPEGKKLTRNRWYRGLAIGIVASLVLALIYNLALNDTSLSRYQPIFWLESAALIFFGMSWFIKGETLFRDAGFNPHPCRPASDAG